MTGDPEEPDVDADDWFEAEGSDITGGAERRGDVRDHTRESWLDGGEDDPRSESAVAAAWNRLAPPQQLGAVIAVLVAVIVIGLAAGGVFSSSGSGQSPIVQPGPVTTFPRTTPATTPAETTPSTTSAATTTTTKTGGTLKTGDRGPAVARLQRTLIALGYGIGKADGVYGPATVRAVTAFQSSSGLPADGVAGPATLKALASTGH
jgi:hypothetical protein